MIKYTEKYTTPTIVELNKDFTMVLEHAYYKEALSDVSIIPFFKYNGQYYYSAAYEFRLIDNNITFIIEELKANTSSKLVEILESSMLKEEKWTNKFKITVINLESPPNYSIPINSEFVFDRIDLEL